MPPVNARFPRSESAFHQNLTKEDREELLKLQSLREIPKSRYATQSCITGLPSGRGRKVVYSHIEIYKMVEDIATDLREAGVRPQTVCAFILHNSIEAVVYFQALQWIGAIAQPIDPNLSQEEIALILKETKAFTVVSALVDEDDQPQDELFQKIKTACASLEIIEWYISRSTNQGVFLERQGRRAGEGAAWAGGAGDFKFDPSETSVRLARPDGESCLAFDVSHRSIASATREFANTYDLTAEMSTLLVFPFHSIQGLMCVLATMYSGGNVVLAEGPSLNPKLILKSVREHRINWFAAEPDTILSVYDEITKEPTVVKDIQLSFIRSIGANIDSDTMRTIEPILRSPVLESYGSEESCGLVSANKDFDFRPGTCGKAVNGCEIVILNPSGENLPPGNVGDIAVRGPHICRGYNNNEYANLNSFVEVSEGETTKKYFVTGDQGSLSTDGFLKITSLRKSRRSVSAVEVQEEDELALRMAEEDKKAEQLKLEREAEVLKIEEQRKAEELRLMQEREAEALRLAEEQAAEQEVESTEEDVEDSDEEEDTVSQKLADMADSRSVSITGNSIEDGLNNDMLEKIMERLDQIENNQERLEREIEASHRLEMEKLRELFEKSEQPRAPEAKPVVNVDMDVINSAVNAAAASAQSSSRDTAAAAQAAKEAAEAAAKAAAAQQALPAPLPPNVVEVTDPSSIQKTVLVSLEDVEEAMKVHPAVANARAFGRPDKKYGTEVFCAINPKKGARVSEPWLKLHAQSVLPAAFVPKKFFYKEDLKDDEEREVLAADITLKRMSHYAGFSTSSGAKVVKGPSWNPPLPAPAPPKVSPGL